MVSYRDLSAAIIVLRKLEFCMTNKGNYETQLTKDFYAEKEAEFVSYVLV